MAAIKWRTKLKCCKKCGAYKGVRLERHHITYRPCYRRVLCHCCHKAITRINTRAARLLGYQKLTNLQRRRIWFFFISPANKTQNMTLSVLTRLLGD